MAKMASILKIFGVKMNLFVPQDLYLNFHTKYIIN